MPDAYSRLLAALFATALLIVTLLVAVPAHADDQAVEQYVAVAAPTVCEVLDDHPTVPGMRGVLQGIYIDSGLSSEDSGMVLAISVVTFCPRHLPLLEALVAEHQPKVLV